MTVVENVEVERAPQPTLDGVYFITPSERSVTRMIGDCKEGVLASACRRFFTSPNAEERVVRHQGAERVRVDAE